jgi:hypothetical protein
MSEWSFFDHVAYCLWNLHGCLSFDAFGAEPRRSQRAVCNRNLCDSIRIKSKTIDIAPYSKQEWVNTTTM